MSLTLYSPRVRASEVSGGIGCGTCATRTTLDANVCLGGAKRLATLSAWCTERSNPAGVHVVNRELAIGEAKSESVMKELDRIDSAPCGDKRANM